MKIRLWVLILVLIVGLLAAGIYLTWNRAGIAQEVEDFFVARLSSLMGAEVQLGEFDLGPGYARIQELSLADERRGLFLSIDAARISYSLLDVILGGFRAEAGLKEVLLSGPRLQVDLDRLLSSIDGGGLKSSRLAEALPQRITVVKGSIVLTRAGERGESELRAFDGWLEMLPDEEGSYRCTGSWGGGEEKNLLIFGNFDQRFEMYTLSAELHHAHLTEVISPALPVRCTLRGDLLRCSLTVEKSRDAAKPVVLGELVMEADELVDEELGVGLERIRADARLEGGKVVVKRVEAAAYGGLVRARGEIADIRRPDIQLQIEAEGLLASELHSQSLGGSPHGAPRGRLDLTGNLRGWGDDMSFQGRMVSNRLEAYGTSFENLRAQLTVRNSEVDLTQVEARLPWAQFGLQGTLDMAQFPAHMEAKWRLDGVELGQFSTDFKLPDMRGSGAIAGRLAGSAGALRLRGGLQFWDVSAGGLSVDRLNGQLHWDRGRLSYRLASSEGYLLLEGGSSGLTRDSNHQGIIRLSHLPLEQIIPGMRMSREGGWVCGRWLFSGTPARARLTGWAELGGDAGLTGRLNSWAEFSGDEEESWRLDAGLVSEDWRVRETPLDLDVSLRWDQDGLLLRELNVDDQLILRGMMATDARGTLDGQLICSQLELGWFGQLVLPGLGHRRPGGQLSGRLDLSGSRDDPRVAGQLEWSDGRLVDLDDLSMRLPIRLSDGVLELERTSLQHHDDPLMNLDGQIDLRGELSFRASGEGVDVKNLSWLMDWEPEAVTGSMDFSCQVQGTTRSPVFDVSAQWTAGRVRKLDFDKFEIELRGMNGQMTLRQFSMESVGKRRLFASGSIPYSFAGILESSAAEGELDLSIGIEGDILSPLPSLSSQILAASGQGRANFRLGGSPGSLILGSGSVQFEDGWIQLDRFVGRLEALDGQLEIDERDHVLEIKKLRCSIEGQPFEVVNFRSLGDDRYEPMEIPGLGLNLGIWGFRTDDAGIEVNIPGLMAPEETGIIRLSGRDGRGSLFLAGPLESPQLVGMLGLNHLDFTYPPFSGPQGELLKFLSRMRWDLTVSAQKDVWYKNDFANLRVKDSESQLHFMGCHQDGTLRIAGRAEADRGEVTYLDRQFQVQELKLEFEGQEGAALGEPDNRPFISGRFETSVYSESTDVATDIFITIYTIDEQTGEWTPRGRWGEFKLELSSNDPNDDTQEKVLAKLGYTGDYGEKALQLLQITLGPKLESYFIDPVLKPVERTIKRALGIDVIRFQPGLTRNLLAQNEGPATSRESLSRRLLLPHSSLLIGKYLTDQCFLSYLGQFRTRTDELLDDRLGIVHSFGLEYRLRGGTILDLQYDYERDLTEGDKDVKVTSDKKVQITHNFPF